MSNAMPRRVAIGVLVVGGRRLVEGLWRGLQGLLRMVRCHKGIVHSRTNRGHALPENGSSVHWDGREVVKRVFSRRQLSWTETGDGR